MLPAIKPTALTRPEPFPLKLPGAAPPRRFPSGMARTVAAGILLLGAPIGTLLGLGPAQEEKKPAKEPNPSADKTPPPMQKVPEGDLAQKGVEVLKTYCYRCHGIDFKVPRFN